MVKYSSTSGLDIPQQPVLRSITLHLLPGVLVTLVYIIVAPFLNSLGYPSNFAFLLAGLFVLVSFELGFLFYQGKKRNGTLSLNGIVLYREPPAAFAVWWKRNIYLGMIVHVVGNVLGSTVTLASILSSP